MQILMVSGGGEGEYIYGYILFFFIIFFFLSCEQKVELVWYLFFFILYQGKKKGVDRNNHKNWVLIHIFIYQRVFAHLRETKKQKQKHLLLGGGGDQIKRQFIEPIKNMEVMGRPLGWF